MCIPYPSVFQSWWPPALHILDVSLPFFSYIPVPLFVPVYLSWCFPLTLLQLVCVSCVPVPGPRSSCVLMCPHVSSVVFPALFSMASGLSSVLYFSTVFLCAFLCLCFDVCILDFGLWLSAYHSSSLFVLFYLPASVCLHLGPRHFTNVYDERVNITFYRRLLLKYEAS